MNALALALWVLAAPPPIDRPVVDLADVLSPAEEDALADQLHALRAGGGPQLAILLVSSTMGVPIEDYAHQAATAWAGGRRGVDDGLLFVVATDDRRVRLEVGAGLEARLPDSEAARLIDQAAPAFRGARWREGAGVVVDGIAARLATGVEGGAPAPPDHTVDLLLFGGGFSALALFLMFLASRSGGRRGASLPYAGAARAGDANLPVEARLPPADAGNAHAEQLAREREAFQKDPDAPTHDARSGATASTRVASAVSSSASVPPSSNRGGGGGGGRFGGGGASGSF